MKVTPEMIVMELMNWMDESRGGTLPRPGSFFSDTDITWREAIEIAAQTPPEAAATVRKLMDALGGWMEIANPEDQRDYDQEAMDAGLRLWKQLKGDSHATTD